MSFESWLEDKVNHEDDPLKLERGTAWEAKQLAEMYENDIGESLTPNQIGGKLAWLRDNEHEHNFEVERGMVTREQINAWVLS